MIRSCTACDARVGRVVLGRRVVFSGCEEAFGVMQVVEMGSAGGGIDPFEAAVGAASGAPAGVFDHLVCGAAGQCEVVDVGLSAVFPVFVAVVGLGVVERGVAAGAGAAAFAAEQCEFLGSGGAALGAAEVQRHGGVAVEDGEVVVGPGGGH